MSDREQQVRERAYALWQAEGAPEGRHQDHWQQAETELGGAAPDEETTGAEVGGQGVSAQAPAEGAADLPAGGVDSPEPATAAVLEGEAAPTAPAEGAPDTPRRRTRKKVG